MTKIYAIITFSCALAGSTASAMSRPEGVIPVYEEMNADEARRQWDRDMAGFHARQNAQANQQGVGQNVGPRGNRIVARRLNFDNVVDETRRV